VDAILVTYKIYNLYLVIKSIVSTNTF